MNIVDFPTLAPAQCAVTRKSQVPCIDLGIDFDFDHAGRFYLSVNFIEDAYHHIASNQPQLLTRRRVDKDELADANARIAELEGALARERAFIEAVDVLESEGFRARKRPGRPKKQPVA